MSTPDTAGGPRVVVDQAALCRLPIGSLLRSTAGTAFRLRKVREPDRFFDRTEDTADLAVLHVDGYNGVTDDPPFPLFVVWTPDAEPTTTSQETTP